MTYLQERLLNEAKDMWERGFRIPTTLSAELTLQGLDPSALEGQYYTDNSNDDETEQEEI